MASTSKEYHLTPQQVNAHPANASLSKQLYSFSKAQRFPKAKTEHSEIDYYLPPSTNSHHSVAMPRQKRAFKHTRDSEGVPAPNQYRYNIEGEFGKKARLTGGYLALGRSVRTPSLRK